MKRPPPRRDRAFLLRVSPYGEDDAIVSLFGERSGLLSALARHARARRGRSPMVLDPFHTLGVELVAGAGELSSLRAAVIDVARARLLESADAMERAGTGSRWARELSPPHAPEPAVFAALERLYDGLERGQDGVVALARFGLALLGALGWGLELGRCVRCGQARPPGRAAFVSAAASGVVCRACGGGQRGADAIDGALLDRLAAEDAHPLDAAGAGPLLRLVEDAVRLHAHAVGARRGGT